MERLLKRNFYNTQYASAYTGPSALKKRFPEYPPEKIDEWARQQDTITKFAPLRKKFKRQFYLAHKRLQCIQLDMADLKKYKRQNNNYAYCEVLVDTLTRFTWLIKLKTKTPQELVKKLRIFIKTNKPQQFFSDMGGETNARVFRAFCKEHDIEIKYAKNEQKAQLAERKIRDLRSRLEKYFFYNKTTRWVDVIDNLVSDLNNSVNRNLKMKPADITTPQLERAAFINLYGKKLGHQAPISKFEINKRYRISHLKNNFAKGWSQSFTNSLYTLVKTVPKEGLNLHVLNAHDGNLRGTFYDKELQRAE
jgi:hypothetical protein